MPGILEEGGDGVGGMETEDDLQEEDDLVERRRRRRRWRRGD